MELNDEPKEFSNEQQMARVVSSFMVHRSCSQLQPHLPAQQLLQPYLSTSDLTDLRRNFQVASCDDPQLMSQLESRLEAIPSIERYRCINHLQKRIGTGNVHSPANNRGHHLDRQENPEAFIDNNLPAHSSDFRHHTNLSYNCQSIGSLQKNSSQHIAQLNYPSQNTISHEVPKNNMTFFDELDFERHNNNSKPKNTLLFLPENTVSGIGMRSVNELASILPENFSSSPNANESFMPSLSPKKNIKKERCENDQLTSLFEPPPPTHNNTSTSPRDNNESLFTQSQLDNAWLLLQNLNHTLTGKTNNETCPVKKEADSLGTVLVDTRPSSVHSLSSDTGASSAQTKAPIRSQSESWSCMPAISHASASSSKDPSYLEKRRKNNESAKRSREARRKRENLLAMRVLELEEENRQLEAKLAMCLEALQHWRRKLFV
ncbi:D site-binding protein [Biomphalaria glabrata]|nr:D site-binding protein-like [Biomphalaria glabrata]